MKPVLLTMSAFGSYAAKTEIDFRKMDHGIFLVTGDTGAGKTTIFDAVTYALYDRPSGQVRDGSMMRSQYAALDTPTYVELVFSYRGEEYRIRRNPEYERLSQRKDKDGNYRKTKEKSQVQLFLPDGSEYKGSKREVNEKIQRIVGLDFKQFTQISMIAQGEFLKLLHARSEERKEIFSKIFDTRIYGRVQEELKQREKNIYVQLKDLERICELQLEEIVCDGQSEWEEELQSIRKGLRISEGIVFLDRLLAAAKERESQKKKMLAKMQRQWELLSEASGILRQEEKTQRELTEICEWLKREEPLAQEKLQKLTEFQTRSEQEDQRMAKELHALEEDLKKYEKLRSVQEKTKKASEEKEIAGRKLDKFRQERKSQEEKEKELQSKQEELSEISVRAVQAAQTVQEKEERQQTFQRLAQIYEKAMEERRRLGEAAKRLKQLQEEFQEKDRRYNMYTEAFLREQAGILASRLGEGEACPVCGSRHHPGKAVLSSKAPNQNMVEESRRQRNQAEEKRNQSMESYQKCQNHCQLQEELWRESVSGVPQEERDYDSSGEKPREWLKRKMQESSEGTKKAKEEAAKFRKMEENLRDIRRELGRIQEQKEKQQGWEELLEKNYRDLEKESLLLQKEEGMLREGLELSWEEAKDKYGRVQKEREKLRLDLAARQREQEERSRKIYENRGKKKALEENFQDNRRKWEETAARFGQMTGEPLQREKAEAVKIEVEREKENLQTELMELYHETEKNGRVREKLRKLEGQYEKGKKEYALVSNLSKTANGGLSQSSRLDFEAYVQRQYFEQIVEYANQRLIQMSSGQFLLQCRRLEDLKNQGKVGLDLDVYSLATDSVRDVKSLSGGESFMAALCMALGLADVVQNTAGAIRLETMFIDEGFGALDDTSREQAVRILQELAGDQKMIGIISHVTELKEQISPKLVVEKTPKGSKAYWA